MEDRNHPGGSFCVAPMHPCRALPIHELVCCHVNFVIALIVMVKCVVCRKVGPPHVFEEEFNFATFEGSGIVKVASMELGHQNFISPG